MAYNILFGAGVQPGHAEQKLNRLDDLIELVRLANPDILGLEEVNGWESGNPSTIEKFANALDMDYYYLASNQSGFNIALFSRLPILETENLSEYIGDHGALRAVVQTPDGNKLNVVVVHPAPISSLTLACQFDKLRRLMESYRDQPSIFMGDLNALPWSEEVKYLTLGGWELVTGEGIDNIFVLSNTAWSRGKICFQRGLSGDGCIGDAGISDHLPVGAVVSFYDFPNTSSLALSPTPPPPVNCYNETEIQSLADSILTAIANRTPDYQDDFSDPYSGWIIQDQQGESGYISGEYFLRTAAMQNAFASSASNSNIPMLTDLVLEIESRFISKQVDGHFQIKYYNPNSSSGYADFYVSLFSGGQVILGLEPGPDVINYWDSPDPLRRLQIIVWRGKIAIHINGRSLIFYDLGNMARIPPAVAISLLCSYS
jgi:endonuclease/exonuclease/phosphatase family metal-dependent hydrolase